MENKIINFGIPTTNHGRGLLPPRFRWGSEQAPFACECQNCLPDWDLNSHPIGGGKFYTNAMFGDRSY